MTSTWRLRERQHLWSISNSFQTDTNMRHSADLLIATNRKASLKELNYQILPADDNKKLTNK